MDGDVETTSVDLEVGIVERAHGIHASVVILPMREAQGLGIYPEGTLTLAKRLRSDRISATYLHDAEHRRFVVQKSAVADVATVLLGIGSSAAWDAVKALFGRSKSPRVDVTYLDLETQDGSVSAWRVIGDGDSVAQTIDALRTQASHPAVETDQTMASESSETVTFDAAGSDEDLRFAYARGQIAESQQAADELLAAAKAALASDPPDRDGAERQARSALQLYARSLNWAEDTASEEDAHSSMDASRKVGQIHIRVLASS